ncbi:MAG: hypothetical protein H0W29_17510 [Gemmatimonadales bacterium]|nr:hypothetical protein [Gemmatimonadales bacterium]
MKCHYPDVFCAALLNAQPMGFYAPAQIVRDAAEHGVEMREVDINHSDWDATLEGESEFPPPLGGRDGEGGQMPATAAKSGPANAVLGGLEPYDPSPLPALPRKGGGSARLHPRHAEQAPAIRTNCAVRLGFRQIKGMREADAAILVSARDSSYRSVRDLWLRSGLSRPALERLAEADAFRSIGLDRRAALWEVRALDPAAAAERLPLFAAAPDDLQKEEPVALPEMPPGEHVVNDYRSLSLSLKAHPVSFLREELRRRSVVEAGRLPQLGSGRRLSVAGLVLVRQRPGTAAGVIFATLEDETGVANIIVWPKIFERYRAIVLGARFLQVTGRLQSEQGVIHVVVEQLKDLSPLLSRLSDDPIGQNGMARADEVRRPVDEHRQKVKPNSRLTRGLASEPELAAELKTMKGAARAAMPKGRNFH